MNAQLMHAVFYASLAITAYVYFGYPLLLWSASLGRREPRRGTAVVRPLVSIIVAAHNEESCIEAKLRNLLALDYPRDRVEILIGSDGSSDRTEEFVSRFAGEGVGLVSLPRQQGKSTMQNSLAAHASGDILMFTDADCLFPPSTLSRMVEHFADPRVGLVSARPLFRNCSQTAVAGNEGIYLRYETWIRHRESDLGLLAVASGSLFCMRRLLWRPLPPQQGDDFVLPLRVIRSGMINRMDPHIIAFTNLSQNRASSMLHMKSRIIAKDFSALLAHRDLLNPFRHGATAIALWSHKLLRWLVPDFLITLLVTNACLLGHLFFRTALAFQCAFYLAALVGFLLRDRQPRIPWSIPMSFCLVNFAALLGTAKALTGRASGVWQPDREPSQFPDFRSQAPSRVPK